MTRTSYLPVEAIDRFPLSAPQQLWHSGDRGDHAGFFSQRFVLATALRITGRVEVPALRAALDEVVARHEILRTVVVRDAEPPYQQVHPATPVPLQIWDLPRASDRSRDVVAEQLLNEVALSPLSPRQLPLLRAELSRFDDADSVLTLLTHHTACDEWSLQVILRDLASCYTARVAGHEPVLPELLQYREFAEAQLAEADSAAADLARSYWQHQLRDAQLFAVPTDREVPEVHTEPYSALNFILEADLIAPLVTLARQVQTSIAAVLLATINVLAHQLVGTTDPAISTLTTGRTDPRFDNSIGPVMNFLVFRTDISDCRSFRELVERTRDGYHEARLFEIPIQQIQRAVPELTEPNDDSRRTNFVLGIHQPPFPDSELSLADGAAELRRRVLPAPVASWIPHGVAWAMRLLPSGELTNCIQFNLEELDESTVAGWADSYQRIVAAAAANPDRDWRAL
jgi:hypothetical protein